MDPGVLLRYSYIILATNLFLIATFHCKFECRFVKQKCGRQSHSALFSKMLVVETCLYGLVFAIRRDTNRAKIGPGPKWKTWTNERRSQLAPSRARCAIFELYGPKPVSLAYQNQNNVSNALWAQNRRLRPSRQRPEGFFSTHASGLLFLPDDVRHRPLLFTAISTSLHMFFFYQVLKHPMLKLANFGPPSLGSWGMAATFWNAGAWGPTRSAWRKKPDGRDPPRFPSREMLQFVAIVHGTYL